MLTKKGGISHQKKRRWTRRTSSHLVLLVVEGQHGDRLDVRHVFEGAQNKVLHTCMVSNMMQGTHKGQLNGWFTGDLQPESMVFPNKFGGFERYFPWKVYNSIFWEEKMHICRWHMEETVGISYGQWRRFGPPNSPWQRLGLSTSFAGNTRSAQRSKLKLG